jgi:hypothetical protein
MSEEKKSTDLEDAKVINFFSTQWKFKTCPMCQKDSWTIIEQSNAAVVFSIPMYSIGCDNCGYTILANKTLVDEKIKVDGVVK